MKERSPIAVIDFENNLIRIHKNTIREIGCPDNILLVVSSQKKMFGIIRCNGKVKDSHTVRFSSGNKDSYEIHSKAFTRQLKEIFSIQDNSEKLRLACGYICRNSAVLFKIKD
ncbi:MAG: hypothetical protein K2K57_11640 [Oscillospiraceae bacterium]|nr:hypothetical protein [Oscillospiraceae bacterium]